MSKRLILILTLAFVAGISAATYAEVQNVKVSGDLTVSGIARSNFDLAKTPAMGSAAINQNFADKESDLLSITRVRVDTDLTDNVSATVRLLNERNWNGESTTGNESNRNVGLTTAVGAEKETQIDLDLAYVTLKEFLYSPLSLKVGRQELRFGTGWIVGDPDTNGIALKSSLAEGDLSSRKAFDAVRVTLDYNPLVVDGIYAKVAENTTVLNDDTTLIGLNAAYELDKNTTLEGFFFSKVKGANAAEVTHVDGSNTVFTSAGVKQAADVVNTVGGRAVNKTLKNLTLDVSGALQFGTYNPKFDPNARYVNANNLAKTSKRRAWGLEALAIYDLKDVAMLSKYSPSITGAYVYLSGEPRDKMDNDDYHGWDGMYENQTFGHIINAIMGFSNVQLGGVNLKAKPIDDLTLSLDYVVASLNKRYLEGRKAILSGVATGQVFTMGAKRYLGQEIDLTLTYDYTEDVQFSLLGGVFLPSKNINANEDSGTGTVYPTGDRTSASELIGSMKVTF